MFMRLPPLSMRFRYSVVKVRCVSVVVLTSLCMRGKKLGRKSFVRRLMIGSCLVDRVNIPPSAWNDAGLRFAPGVSPSTHIKFLVNYVARLVKLKICMRKRATLKSESEFFVWKIFVPSCCGVL